MQLYLQFRYLNLRLRYYFFRVTETDGRHVGILLSICNLVT